jgi:hypothetical protein
LPPEACEPPLPPEPALVPVMPASAPPSPAMPFPAPPLLPDEPLPDEPLPAVLPPVPGESSSSPPHAANMNEPTAMMLTSAKKDLMRQLQGGGYTSACKSAAIAGSLGQTFGGSPRRSRRCFLLGTNA